MSRVSRRKARLILTFDCPRRCPNCANTQIQDLDAVPRIDSIEALDDYDEVILTGGEPMLDAGATVSFAQGLKERKQDRIVYAYAALWSPFIRGLLRVVDGLHYTIHTPTTSADIEGLVSVEREVAVARRRRPELSCRLYVQADVSVPVPITPSLWTRVEIAPFKEDCPVPADETLLVWDPEETA